MSTPAPRSLRARFYTLDVFTDRPFGGNPLAVFPDATKIPEAALQSIALELNLSETVFVYPPADPKHTRRVRIFTPVYEMPFAGHPTVGCAFALAALGEIPLEGETRIVLEEGVGPVPVLIRGEFKKPEFAQLSVAKLPETGPPPPGRSHLADMLSLDPSDILGGMSAPQAISCGFPFLMVPLRDLDAVRRARVRMDQWDSALKSYWAPDVMVFARDAEREGVIRARVFVPGQGIIEDPATGSAAAALGGYLAARESAPSGNFSWVVEQGFEIKRPSFIELEVDKKDGEVTAVRVGGSAVMVSEAMMEVPLSQD
ncbi:MAG: Phenazine biosynthesis protein PhzF family protein [Gemmatimonadetes bacterium]|nr:Phenazine biosynthesis protein PhzF family protein [Gemmatimonadota bacterium]